MRIRHSIWIAGLLILLSLSVVFAQDAACTTLVQQAMTNLGSDCDALDRNSACYGFNRVDATFGQPQADGFFSHPADRAGLLDLQTISTAPLDVNAQQWGLAALNVQANLPTSLPGQAVTVILVGETTVTNGVGANEAMPLTMPVQVTTRSSANVRSRPLANANVVASVRRGTDLMSDGVSQNGDWLRVVSEDNLPGWVSRDLVVAQGDLNTLPTLNGAERSPMQAFVIRTGFGQPACQSTPPSMALLQTPQHILVNMTINGSEVRFGSTIIVWQTEANTLAAAVLDGVMYFGDLIIPTGFMVTAQIDLNTGDIVGGWGQLQPMSQDLLDKLTGLGDIPQNLLHYPIQLPTQADIQNYLASLNQGNQPPAQAGSTQEAVAIPSGGCVTLLSPREGLAYGPTHFYWTGLPGAASYVVNFYDENMVPLATYPSNGAENSAVGNTSLVRPGYVFWFYWEVVALDAHGNPICVSERLRQLRAAPPEPPTVAPPSGG